MSFIKSLKTLFGIGPFLLFIFILIESISIYVQQWVKLSIGLSFNTQVALTIFIGTLLLSGLVWFNFSLNLEYVTKETVKFLLIKANSQFSTLQKKFPQEQEEGENKKQNKEENKNQTQNLNLEENK